MLKKVIFEYNYADIMRALRPFSSRPITEKDWKNLNPRYISYYENQSSPPIVGQKGGPYPYQTKSQSKDSINSKSKKDGYSPAEIVCVINAQADTSIKIYVYTGIRRGSDIILNSIELKVFDSQTKNFNYSIEEVSIKNNAKSHVLERLQKNVAKLIKKIKEDIKLCPEEDCGGFIVEKYSPKTQSNFWACNRYPKCKHIDKEKSKKENRGIEPGHSDKVCSECGKKMISRTAKKGPLTGKQFWGCSAYPNCEKTESI